MAPPPMGRERHKDKDSSVIAADGGQALRQEVGKRHQPNREQEGHKAIFVVSKSCTTRRE